MSKNQKVGGDEKWLHLFLAIGIFWGCSFLFIEQALKFLNPVGVSFLRCLCGAMTIWIIVLVKKIKIPRERKLWMHMFALALMTNVIPGTLIALAQTNVTSLLAGIINSTPPLTTLLAIMFFFRHETIKSHQVLGLFIGFIGVGVGRNDIAFAATDDFVREFLSAHFFESGNHFEYRTTGSGAQIEDLDFLGIFFVE